jgi:predicted glycogen debranching enzyme
LASRWPANTKRDSSAGIGSVMQLTVKNNAEWLEADGLGGFASGTVGGVRARRYHALLLTATTPPAGRIVLVNGFDAWVQTPTGTFAISSQRYAPGVTHPDGTRRIESFTPEPWPRWRLRLDDGTQIEHEIFACSGASVVGISWRVIGSATGVTLAVRPFLSGRDYHSLHHENPAFQFDAQHDDGRIVWRPYQGLPGIISCSNAEYAHEPTWYRNFLYEEERSRGLGCTEDLASPGILRWDLSRGAAIWVLAAEGYGSTSLPSRAAVDATYHSLRAAEEQRRARFSTRLQRSADAYLVQRGAGKTIVAGYPWFTDWGRDTFIALRGLCLATGRLDEARAILLEWAGSVSEGMLPNRFPDRGDAPEFNAVDASLWYVVAVHDFLQAATASKFALARPDQQVLTRAIEAILSGYAKGTRYQIHVTDDGLLAAGQAGVQLTWMDAKVGDWVVTPRIGKPVEVQALWLNALRIGAASREQWSALLARGTAAFQGRFWNDGGYLNDVVDVDHQAGTADGAFRPNQIFAVGGLPFAVLDGERARQVVEAVEARLFTPFGLRSLAPGEAGYAPRYEGGVRARDGAYHQGTVWPWLMGPFVEAWVRIHGNTRDAKRAARKRYLEPLLQHLDDAGLGHLSEIADAEPPHAPRGCPFQAWSVGEALRLQHVVLAE